MTIQSVTTFVTSDGKKHGSLVEAQGHEEFIKLKPRLKAFVLAAEIKGAQATLAMRNVSEFLAWDKVTDPSVLVHDAEPEVAATPAVESPAAPAEPEFPA